jgi:hypothetical protein
MKKNTYIRCPRCELNFILKEEDVCSVCKSELSAARDEEMDDFDMEVCPICKSNYITVDEVMCETCAKDKSDDVIDPDEWTTIEPEDEDLLDENLSLKQEENAVPQTASRILTVIFSISIVWLIIIIAYIYRQMIVDTNDWLLFVAGAPISSLVAFYFNRKWGNKVLSIIISSLFVWSLIATVYLYYLSYNMWPLFLLGLPCQAAIITGFFLKGTRK